jgi:soluble lytic murein transglycosylase-like protein
VESNFNPNAKSRKGAIGLMGILPSVWLNDLKENGIIHSKRDLYLMSKNIASGVHILKKYLLRSNNLTKALVDYVGGDPNYVNKVLKAMGEIYLAKMLNSSAIS